MTYSILTIADKSQPERLVLFGTIAYTILGLATAAMLWTADSPRAVALIVQILINWLLTWYVMYVINCVNKANTKGCKELTWVISIVRLVDMFMVMFFVYLGGTSAAATMAAKTIKSTVSKRK